MAVVCNDRSVCSYINMYVLVVLAEFLFTVTSSLETETQRDSERESSGRSY